MERCQEDAEFHATMGHMPVLHVYSSAGIVQRWAPVAKTDGPAQQPRGTEWLNMSPG